VFEFLLILASLAGGGPAPTADAVSYAQDGSRLAAARVRNWISGYQTPGPSITGSGTLIAVEGAEGVVLTAAHLFQGKQGPTTVEFPDGQISGATILAMDAKLDVAVLWIYAPKGIVPVPLADHDPALGDLVEIWGYGPKRFRSFLAKVANPIPMEGDPPRALIGAQGVLDKQVTIPGDSGGPIIREGKLVAVHWGYRGSAGDPRRCVHALGCSRLNDWLKHQLSPQLCQRCLAVNSTEAPDLH
jgi:hypothetical protein